MLGDRRPSRCPHSALFVRKMTGRPDKGLCSGKGHRGWNDILIGVSPDGLSSAHLIGKITGSKAIPVGVVVPGLVC